MACLVTHREILAVFRGQLGPTVVETAIIVLYQSGDHIAAQWVTSRGK